MPNFLRPPFFSFSFDFIRLFLISLVGFLRQLKSIVWGTSSTMNVPLPFTVITFFPFLPSAVFPPFTVLISGPLILPSEFLFLLLFICCSPHISEFSVLGLVPSRDSAFSLFLNPLLPLFFREFLNDSVDSSSAVKIYRSQVIKYQTFASRILKIFLLPSSCGLLTISFEYFFNFATKNPSMLWVCG